MMMTVMNHPEIALDEFVIMPDHVHAIVAIMECDGGLVGASQWDAPTGKRSSQQKRNVEPGSIGAIVRAYKSAVAVRINQRRETPGRRVWQRNYWERIIRNGGELMWIREYIRNNPIRRGLDCERGSITPPK
jgi:putative transposase